MQSVLNFTARETTKNVGSYRRENSFWSSWILLDLETGREVVDARFYGAAATVYCVIWCQHLQEYRGIAEYTARGCGKAGGYGYHKASAAMAEALEDAGLKFAENIGGVGETAMRDAMLAIAEYLGIARPHIVRAHP